METQTLDRDGLAAWLEMSRKWVEKYTAQGRIPGMFRAGRRWRYRREEIEKQRLKTGQVLLPKGRK